MRTRGSRAGKEEHRDEVETTRRRRGSTRRGARGAGGVREAASLGRRRGGGRRARGRRGLGSWLDGVRWRGTGWRKISAAQGGRVKKARGLPRVSRKKGCGLLGGPGQAAGWALGGWRGRLPAGLGLAWPVGVSPLKKTYCSVYYFSVWFLKPF